MEKINIIKVGGAIVEEPKSLRNFLQRFANIPGNKILVHGGGRSATNIAAALGIESHMEDGRRITDDEMLRVVTMVYGGLVNKNIVAQLQAIQVNALGLTGADMNVIRSHRRPAGLVDYGWVGDVDQVDASRLSSLLRNGITPVMAPLTHDAQGHLLNTNADTIASQVATALSSYFAVTLTYCFEKPGVLRNPDDDTSVIPLIMESDYQMLVAEGVISGGMLPKLDNAFRALHRGVQRVIITNASHPDGAGGTVIR